MDFRSFTTAFGLWQIVYLLISRLLSHFLTHRLGESLVPDKNARQKLSRQAPAYLISTIHALIVTFRGIQHLRGLLHAPILVKLQRPPLHIAATLPNKYAPFVAEADRVLVTNVILAAYLFADLIHILRQYPALGAVDTIAHHIAFLSCALVAGWYSLCPFMFSWLIIGEASTPFLNARWLLIRSGRGDAWYFKYVEMAFAFVFLIMRFFIYAAGLAYQLSIVAQVPHYVPTWAVFATMSFVVTGFILNLTWLGKIYKLATGTGKRRAHAEVTTDQSLKSD